MSLVIRRSTKIACATAAIAASLAMGVAPHAGAATAVSIGATGSALQNQPVGALHGWQYTHNFWGSDPDGVVTNVEVLQYPSLPVFMDYSVQTGAAALDARIRALEPGEKLVIATESQGQLVVAYLFNKYADDPTSAPDLSNVVVVSAGDPSAPTGFAGKDPGGVIPIVGLTNPGSMPTTVRGFSFVRELDFFAYTPNNLMKALLDPVVAANFFASFLAVHPHYGVIDPDNLSPNTWVKKDGEVTYYVVEERVAPAIAHMEAGFRALGLGAVFDRLNKAMLDHIRPYYSQNLEGFVRLDSLPTAETDVSDQHSISEVPVTTSMSLRGSLPSELQQASPASSSEAKNGNEEKVYESESPLSDVMVNKPESVLPDPTPPVVKEQQDLELVVEEQKSETPVVQNQPQGNLNEGTEGGDEDKKASETEKPKDNDGDNESDNKESLKSGEGVKRAVVGSHGVRPTATQSGSDDGKDSKKPSATAGSTSSPSSSASPSSSNSSSSSNSNSGGDE